MLQFTGLRLCTMYKVSQSVKRNPEEGVKGKRDKKKYEGNSVEDKGVCQNPLYGNQIKHVITTSARHPVLARRL